MSDKFKTIRYSEVSKEGEISVKTAKVYALPFFSHRQSALLMNLISSEKGGGVGMEDLVEIARAIVYKIELEDGTKILQTKDFFDEKDIDINSLAGVSEMITEMMSDEGKKKIESVESLPPTSTSEAVHPAST